MTGSRDSTRDNTVQQIVKELQDAIANWEELDEVVRDYLIGVTLKIRSPAYDLEKRWYYPSYARNPDSCVE